jgi:L-histidine N-alpha-methyltransferase
MVLVAQAEATKVIGEKKCFPLVCDLASAGDWEGIFEHVETAGVARLVTFFGMIPNFEPEIILPRLSGFLRPGDWLLFSANLAPGNDYAAGVQQVLPLYDNELTREWLLTFLLDLGVERTDGEIRFVVEEEPPGGGLKRIAAYFDFRRPRRVSVDKETFEFQPGDSLRLFFSYRHTAALVRQMLAAHDLQVLEQWVTKSEEEGVFLAQRAV